MSVCGSAPVCKANCSLNVQWKLAESGQIAADSDVVGAGVLISFIVSAHTTFIVVVIGYLTFSFEDKCKNRADDVIVGSTRRLLRRIDRSIKPIYRQLWLIATNIFQPIFRFILRLCFLPVPKKSDVIQVAQTPSSDLPEPEDDPARKYRIEALREFMLALSDQQLVTGVAMLVAAFGRWTEITVYSANVVSALAFFSASVHMGTLDFLTTYLRRHGVVKGFRVFFMAITVILLVSILSLQLSSTWWNTEETSNVDLIPHLEGDLKRRRSNLFLVCAFWDFSLELFDGNGFFSRFYVIVIVIYAHFERARTLYSTWGRLPQGEDLWTKERLRKHGIDKFDYRTSLYKQRAREIILSPPSWRKSFSSWRLIESFAFHETYASRIWNIAALLYSNIYGAILIFYYRQRHEGTVGPFNTMGFGQIVPVFLLVLLIFAAIESIYGYKDALEELSASVADAGSIHQDETHSVSPISSSDNSTRTAHGEHEISESELDIAEVSLDGTDSDHASNGSLDVGTPHETSPSGESSNTEYFEARPTQSLHFDEGENGLGAMVQREELRADLFVPESPERTFSTGVQATEIPMRPSRRVPRKRSLRRHRDTHTQAGIRPPPLQPLSSSIASLGVQGNFTRHDTEATIGLPATSAEALFNAIQDDPKSLLARFIREDPFSVREVQRIILGYAISILVVQSVLASATHGILGYPVFFVLAAIITIPEVRFFNDLFRRLRRINRIGERLRQSQQKSVP